MTWVGTPYFRGPALQCREEYSTGFTAYVGSGLHGYMALSWLRVRKGDGSKTTTEHTTCSRQGPVPRQDYS